MPSRWSWSRQGEADTTDRQGPRGWEGAEGSRGGHGKRETDSRMNIFPHVLEDTHGDPSGPPQEPGLSVSECSLQHKPGQPVVQGNACCLSKQHESSGGHSR